MAILDIRVVIVYMIESLNNNDLDQVGDHWMRNTLSQRDVIYSILTV